MVEEEKEEEGVFRRVKRTRGEEMEAAEDNQKLRA